MFLNWGIAQYEGFAKFPPQFIFAKVLIFSSNQRTKENHYKTAFSKLKILRICGNLGRCLLNKNFRAVGKFVTLSH